MLGRRVTDTFLADLRIAQQGRLKIFLGMAAGVGKTVAMLRDARRLRDEGIDVVCGFVETHGRAETGAELGDRHMESPAHWVCRPAVAHTA